MVFENRGVAGVDAQAVGPIVILAGMLTVSGRFGKLARPKLQAETS